MEDDIIVAGDHPGDHNSALEYDLSEVANNENYDGQGISLEGGPGGTYQGDAQGTWEQSDDIQGLMPRDEEPLEEDTVDRI